MTDPRTVGTERAGGTHTGRYLLVLHDELLGDDDSAARTAVRDPRHGRPGATTDSDVVTGLLADAAADLGVEEAALRLLPDAPPVDDADPVLLVRAD